MHKTRAALAKGFESSSGKTLEFMAFVRTFKSEFGRYVEGCAPVAHITWNVGHFEISGFVVLKDGRVYYINTGDVRGSSQELGLLIRTAKDTKDYTGGVNNHRAWGSLQLDSYFRNNN